MALICKRASLQEKSFVLSLNLCAVHIISRLVLECSIRVFCPFL